MKVRCLYFVTFFFFVWGIIGCNTDQSRGTDIKIDGSIQIDTLTVEDEFMVGYLMFGIDNKLPLSSIGDVVVDNKICLYDGSQRRFFISEADGSKLTDITRLGNGPGEYSNVLSVYIGDSIYVCSGAKLGIYDKRIGAFSRTIKVPLELIGNFIVKDGILYYSSYGSFVSGVKNELVSFKLGNKHVHEILPFVDNKDQSKDGSYTVMGQYLTMNKDGEVLFTRKNENIIYQIVNNEAIVKYRLFFNSDDKLIIPVENRDYMNLQQNTLQRFFETDQCLYVSMLHRNSQNEISNRLLKYDIKTGETSVYGKVWSELFDCEVELIQYKGGKLIGVINSSLVNYLADRSQYVLNSEHSSQTDKDKALSILSYIGDARNPILLVLEAY